jgi:hypothetical protein
MMLSPSPKNLRRGRTTSTPIPAAATGPHGAALRRRRLGARPADRLDKNGHTFFYCACQWCHAINN